MLSLEYEIFYFISSNIDFVIKDIFATAQLSFITSSFSIADAKLIQPFLEWVVRSYSTCWQQGKRSCEMEDKRFSDGIHVERSKRMKQDPRKSKNIYVGSDFKCVCFWMKRMHWWVLQLNHFSEMEFIVF